MHWFDIFKGFLAFLWCYFYGRIEFNKNKKSKGSFDKIHPYFRYFWIKNEIQRKNSHTKKMEYITFVKKSSDFSIFLKKGLSCWKNAEKSTSS